MKIYTVPEIQSSNVQMHGPEQIGAIAAAVLGSVAGSVASTVVSKVLD